MQNRNVRIAKQLLRLARGLVATYGYPGLVRHSWPGMNSDILEGVLKRFRATVHKTYSFENDSAKIVESFSHIAQSITNDSIWKFSNDGEQFGIKVDNDRRVVEINLHMVPNRTVVSGIIDANTKIDSTLAESINAVGKQFQDAVNEFASKFDFDVSFE